MAIIPPEFESLVEATIGNVPSPQDQTLGPVEHPAFETLLERLERRLNQARQRSLFGVHPDGVGPTLGQDLGKPNTGLDLDWDHQGFDPTS